jgi:putative hydrolase of HD superfamily
MDLQKFFETALRLKDVKREGWIERGVKGPESSAEHSFMVALMVLVFGKGRKIDMEKALKIAIIHDLPEAIVGDIISKDNWEKGGQMWDREKQEKERPAVKELSSLSGSGEMLELWEEFESQKTPEAKFLKELDRLATILQALEYHKKGNFKKPLQGFWDGKGVSNIRDPGLKKFLEGVLGKHPQGSR